MGNYQLKVVGNIVPFVPKPRAAAYLTSLDRLEISRWREHARQCGYDRMEVYEREPGDYAKMGNILCLYLEGQPWSRWVFARMGGVVSAWCSLTSVDIGEFTSLSAAFQAVMPPPAWMAQAGADGAESGVVTEFVPRLRRASGT